MTAASSTVTPTPSAVGGREARDLMAGNGATGLWGRRGSWQIRLRWAVAPLMLLGIVIGRALGFSLPVIPILLIAAASLAYNGLFALAFRRYKERLQAEPSLDRLFTFLEAAADYAAMFLLIYFTGGVWSPLLVFLIFHVIIAAIHFRAASAFALAGVAAAGLWTLLAGQTAGWLRCHHLSFRGEALHFVDQPASAAVSLLFFTATLFITAAIVSSIMQRLRERVGDLAKVTSELATANERLHSLYTMLSAVGAERRMTPVLTSVTEELAKVTDVPAVAVKLLSDDRQSLRYVAAHGLPEELVREKVVSLDRSPLNQRVIDGETLVEGRVSEGDSLQLRRELADLGIESAVLTPLKVADRVIGTLGFYARVPDRFDEQDRAFLQLAAELVAIAIDNARAYEAIEVLMRERTQFMLEVAHNLRAPLAAGLSILELLNDGYLGKLTPKQTEHLVRLDARLRALNQAIGELLAIARTRDTTREIPDVEIDLRQLARHTKQVFEEEAAAKRLRFEVEAGDGLPPIASGVGLLEQMMENLVSNAVKYTPQGGEVAVRMERISPGVVRITVRDSGIGIPEAEQNKLFKTFFRASNAKKLTTEGTGLGLTLVKQTVDRHRGCISVDSEEGRGTTVVVELPLRRPDESAA